MPVSLETVVSLAQAIYAQYEQAKANQAQCHRLTTRVRTIVTAIQDLDTLPDNRQFTTALHQLEACLQDIHAFIQSFSGDHWMRRLIQAGGHKRRFTVLNEQLQANSTALNLGINAQQLFNREQGQADQQQDQQFIKDNQAKLLQQGQVLDEKLEGVGGQQRELRQLVQRQFASLKSHLRLLTEEKTTVRSPRLAPESTIAFHELRFQEKLDGEGLSAVYRGRWCEQDVAIKLLEGSFTDKEYRRFIAEVKQLSRLRHAHVVTCYGACVDRDNPCLVLAYHPQRDLGQLLTATSPLSEPALHRIAVTLAQGMYFLHERQVVHRHISLRHILLDAQGQACLTGFGVGHSQASQTRSVWARSANALRWTAPECLQGQPSTVYSDSYSVGLVMWSLLARQLPYATLSPSELTKQVIAGYREPIYETWPTVYQRLIRACLSPNPIKRPKPSALLESLRAYTPRPPSPSMEAREQLAKRCEEKQDYTQARQHYHRAMTKGSIKAGSYLADLFLKGLGGQKDADQARTALETSAGRGHVRSMWNLAQLLEYDQTQLNYPQALQWYQKIVATQDPTYATKAQARVIRVQEKIQAAGQPQTPQPGSR